MDLRGLSVSVSESPEILMNDQIFECNLLAIEQENECDSHRMWQGVQPTSYTHTCALLTTTVTDGRAQRRSFKRHLIDLPRPLFQ